MNNSENEQMQTGRNASYGKVGTSAEDQTQKGHSLWVSWQPPKPRAGALGAWDKFVGPGATSAEENLQLILGGLIAIGGVALFWLFHEEPSTLWQWLFVVVLAFDIGGGIVTNSTSAAKRWYHRAGHTKLKHFGFVATHLVHIVLMGFLFSANPLAYSSILGLLLITATLFMLWSPLYLQRPMAVGLAMLIIMLGQLPLFDLTGLNWFIPALMLKLLLGHALKEAPFQPGDK